MRYEGPMSDGMPKAMFASVEASLRRLKADRIDIYWVHYPDNVIPIEEIVRGFEDLGRAGKTLYAGLSNFPAWRLARAVTLAELSLSAPIAAAQFEHSLVHREPEADLFPASEALRLGVVTRSPLGGGMLTGEYRNGEKGRAEGRRQGLPAEELGSAHAPPSSVRSSCAKPCAAAGLGGDEIGAVVMGNEKPSSTIAGAGSGRRDSNPRPQPWQGCDRDSDVAE